MTDAAPSLLREWDWLVRKVIPPLLQVEHDGPPSVWSMGSAADAAAIAIAYRHLQMDRGHLPSLRVFASELLSGRQPVTFMGETEGSRAS